MRAMSYRKISTRRLEVYGISGNKGHGKDTFANLITQANTSYKVVPFAGALKRMSARIFGLTYAQMNDPSLKEIPLPHARDMDLFVPAMKAETGLHIQPAGKIAHSPREVMQFFGTEYVRRIQDDYWIQKLLAEVGNSRQVLIPDVRFPNEAAALRSYGGIIIKVERIDAPVPKDGHLSETEMAKIIPDLLVGARTGDLSLPSRIARLIAMNRFDSATSYDYRKSKEAIASYTSGKSAEESSLLLGHKHPYALYNTLDYYGVQRRKQAPNRVHHKVVDGVVGKFCIRCVWQPLIEFNMSTKAWDGKHSLCRACASLDHKDRYQKYGKTDSLSRVYAISKKQAAQRGIPFNLRASDIQFLWNAQGGRCTYSGLEMTTELRSPNKVTIDRIDSSKGYEIDNIVLCGYRVNLMKREMSLSEFKGMIRTLYENLAGSSFGSCGPGLG